MAKELFCPMFWVAGQAIEDPDIRYVFAYGGSSASKTYSIVQKLILETLQKGVNTIVMRKTSTSITRSIYSDFQLVVKNWGLEEFFVFQQLMIKCVNGAKIEFTGLDDPEKIKGITGFTYAVMEEFNEFDKGDFDQMGNRMRGLPNQTIICIWNPIDELHWVKKHAIDRVNEEDVPTQKWKSYSLKDRPLTMFPESIHDYINSDIVRIQTQQINEKGNSVLLHTNYKDNWYVSGHPDGKHGMVDKHQLDNFATLKETDFEYYRVYALGLWGRADRGDEFYKNFDEKRHVIEQERCYNDIEFPLHITFDENVNPFLTLNIWQAAGKVVRQIDEITLKHPRNTLDETLREFKRRFPPKSGNKRVFIYGDATSRKADVKQEKGKDFYTIIEAFLEKNGYEFNRCVPNKNPNIALRGGFINRIFSKRGFNGIEIGISSKCKNSIYDYQYVKEAADGTKHKQMVKDPDTEVRYQKFGHTSDANDYFLIQYFNESWELYIDGDEPSTPVVVPRVHKYVW